jgi:hypothetical protein
MNSKVKQDLTDLAGALRVTANEVERIGKEDVELPRVDVHDAICRFAPDACYTSVEVNMSELLGQARLDLQAYMRRDAARQLAHFILKKHDFQMKDRTPPQGRDPAWLLYRPDITRFEAQLIPFTRAELERYTRDVVALAQGRIT